MNGSRGSQALLYGFCLDYGRFDRVDRDDVGMIESSYRLGLTFEALEPIRIIGHFRWENLEGHLAVELGVLGSIHLTHTAFAELAGDFVVGERLANHVCSGL